MFPWWFCFIAMTFKKCIPFPVAHVLWKRGRSGQINSREVAWDNIPKLKCNRQNCKVKQLAYSFLSRDSNYFGLLKQADRYQVILQYQLQCVELVILIDSGDSLCQHYDIMLKSPKNNKQHYVGSLTNWMTLLENQIYCSCFTNLLFYHFCLTIDCQQWKSKIH